MKLNTIVRLCALIALSVSTSTFAEDFDGSKPMLCSISDFSECTITGCEKVTAYSIGAPRLIRIDAKGKSIAALGGGAGRKSKIDHVDLIDGKLIIIGAEDGVEGVRDGLGYSMTIAMETGELVFSASADGAAFTGFGVCVVE